MSIDATIRDVTHRDDGSLVLNLQPRFDERTGRFSTTGQDHLRVVDPTWEPPVGSAIWGGSGEVYVIVNGVEVPYEREGYTRLHQGKWFAKSVELATGAEVI